MEQIKDLIPNYIAGGRPADDTLRHYNAEIDNFLAWCDDNGYNPLVDINATDAIQYMHYLFAQHFAPASVNLKICAARTFYHVAIKLKLCTLNPFADVHPRVPAYDDDCDFFNPEELKQIYNSIIARDDITAKRDLAIFMLMAVEGLRTVEIHRMNDADINWERKSILVHGKGRDSYIYPCDDTLSTIKCYIDSRPAPLNDKDGTPTFIGFSPKFLGARISRNGIRWAINHILLTVDKKTKGNSCHTLRHSCGTNLYAGTKDLRLVQETLRHKDPQTTARYAHVVDRLTQRPTSIISPVE